MLEFEELSLKLSSYKDALKELYDAIGYESLIKQIDMLETQSAAPGFWDDTQNSQEILQKISRLKAKTEEYSRIKLLFD